MLIIQLKYNRIYVLGLYNNNLCTTLLSEITVICTIHRANHGIKFMTAFFCKYVSNEDKL